MPFERLSGSGCAGCRTGCCTHSAVRPIMGRHMPQQGGPRLPMLLLVHTMCVLPVARVLAVLLGCPPRQAPALRPWLQQGQHALEAVRRHARQAGVGGCIGCIHCPFMMPRTPSAAQCRRFARGSRPLSWRSSYLALGRSARGESAGLRARAEEAQDQRRAPTRDVRQRGTRASQRGA